ncbi:T-cell-interacting, activating receptor on myeloid cells protein 1-like [Emydura macquarii macquarii]|uniref:T-cell-interacting, activating receptor on myeloid cells protein 1-like n=1 Tax=Emydura macquarii macquarii TaxID=1129001 RepID=UPI003529D75F
MASGLMVLLLEGLYPKPNISVSPSGVIPVGGNITISCWHQQYRGMIFLLSKDGNYKDLRYTDPAGLVAEFPIICVRREQRGNYTCRFAARTGYGAYSDPSDPVQIIVGDERPSPDSLLPPPPPARPPGDIHKPWRPAEPSLPKPSISISPSRGVSLGEAATICCGAGPQNATFLLYKDGGIWGRAMPRGDVAEFSVASVTEEDVGSYSCSYFTRREPVALSYPSDPAWLAVRDYTWGNVARLAVGTGVLLALALILAEAARGWRRGGC